MATSKSGGIGLFGLLGVVFVTLKLCNVIAWSWWFVLLPFYFWIAIFLICILIIGFAEWAKSL